MRPAHFFALVWCFGWMAFFGLFTIPAIGMLAALLSLAWFLFSIGAGTINTDVYSKKFLTKEDDNPFVVLFGVATWMASPFVVNWMLG